MMKYAVDVCRRQVAHTTVVVEANDEVQAKARAAEHVREALDTYGWSEWEDDYVYPEQAEPAEGATP